MSDATQAQAMDVLAAAIAVGTGLRADRQVLGNRETAWTVTDGAFRLDPTEWEDLGWYAGDDRIRVQESVTVHIVHRVASDPRRSMSAAREAAARIVRDVRLSSTVITAGLVIELGGAVTVTQAGDVVETDVPLFVSYDFAVTQAA